MNDIGTLNNYCLAVLFPQSILACPGGHTAIFQVKYIDHCPNLLGPLAIQNIPQNLLSRSKSLPLKSQAGAAQQAPPVAALKNALSCFLLLVGLGAWDHASNLLTSSGSGCRVTVASCPSRTSSAGMGMSMGAGRPSCASAASTGHSHAPWRVSPVLSSVMGGSAWDVARHSVFHCVVICNSTACQSAYRVETVHHDMPADTTCGCWQYWGCLAWNKRSDTPIRRSLSGGRTPGKSLMNYKRSISVIRCKTCLGRALRLQ